MVVKIEGEYYRVMEASNGEWQVDKHPDIKVREVENHLFEAFRDKNSLGRFHDDDVTPLTIQRYS